MEQQPKTSNNHLVQRKSMLFKLKHNQGRQINQLAAQEEPATSNKQPEASRPS
jgi:hypothetical protein